MEREMPAIHEITQLTGRTLLRQWGRFFLSFLGGTLALVTFFTGVLTLPRLWQQYSLLQEKEKNLEQFSSQAAALLNEMHRTIELSEEQTQRLRSLSGRSPARYPVDPRTGAAIVYYDEIIKN